jgi:hypothetical protein
LSRKISATRVVGRQRFGVDDVEAGSGQSGGCERVGERRLIDQFTASDVDEHGVRRHRCDHLGADDPPGLGSERQGHDDGVGVADRVGEFGQRAHGAGFVAHRRASHHDGVHPECRGQPHDLLTDRSVADDGDALALEIAERRR